MSVLLKDKTREEMHMLNKYLAHLLYIHTYTVTHIFESATYFKVPVVTYMMFLSQMTV